MRLSILFLGLVFAATTYLVWRQQDSTTRSVLAHLSLRERLVFYGIPAGYGLSMPALTAIIATLLWLGAPKTFFLRHFVVALCFVAPVYAVTGILLQGWVKAYLRRFLAESAWAKAQGIDASAIKL